MGDVSSASFLPDHLSGVDGRVGRASVPVEDHELFRRLGDGEPTLESPLVPGLREEQHRIELQRLVDEHAVGPFLMIDHAHARLEGVAVGVTGFVGPAVVGVGPWTRLDDDAFHAWRLTDPVDPLLRRVADPVLHAAPMGRPFLLGVLNQVVEIAFGHTVADREIEKVRGKGQHHKYPVSSLPGPAAARGASRARLPGNYGGGQSALRTLAATDALSCGRKRP